MLLPRGVRVALLTPGLLPSELAARTPYFHLEIARKRGPESALAGREHIPDFLGQPEDVARAALYLASDEAAMVTGAALDVDGGILVSNGTTKEEYFGNRT